MATDNTSIVNTDVGLAIKEAELDQLILEIISFADRVSILFDKIDDQFELLPDNFKSESLTEITNKYNMIKNNYTVIIDNIKSYSDDLVNLKAKVIAGLSDIASIFDSGAQEFDNLERRIDINGS